MEALTPRAVAEETNRPSALRQARVALEAMRLLPRGADNVFAGVAAMLAALQHGLSLRARVGERRQNC